MDILKNDLLENSLMKNENSNNLNNVETLIYMDSSEESRIDKNLIENEVAKNILAIHTPSPMVARSCFTDSNCDSWKNVSIFSYSRNNGTGESDNSNAFNHTNKYSVYNVISDNSKAPITHNWINCQQVQNCSPELIRRNDIIFEENTQIDNNGDLDNSDYSDRSQSPINSASSDDSSGSNSNSSANNSPDDESQSQEQQQQEISLSSLTSQSDDEYNISQPIDGDDETRIIDFSCIFTNGDDEFSGKRYHQPPKAIDREAAKRLARRLYDCDGFKITDVAKHLSKRNDFSQIVGEEFANFFDLTGMRLDTALRLFLGRFTLTGDTQERERIMHHFSRRYVGCNGEMYNGEDACHTLVCALIILNTNLHSQTFPKMSSSDFIQNLKDLNDGENFPSDNLEELYGAIEKEPIRWPLDDELVGIVNINKSDMMDMSKQMMNTSFNIGYDEPRDSNSRDFMSGYVVRKWLKEPGGRKTAFGKRGWKLFYGRLRDLTIYLYKDHDKSCSQPKPVPKRQNSVKKVKEKSFKHAKKPSNINNNNNNNNNNSNNSMNSENLPIAPESTDNTSPELCRSDELNGENDRSNADQISNNNNNQFNSNDRAKDLSPSTETNNSIPLPTVIKTTTDSVEATASNVQPSLILPPADSEIHIHHAFATRAVDYVKKKNVFRVKTKYGSEYLFQVNNEKEMESWIDNINYVAALLSDPEPIIGISTMEKLSSRSIPRPKITTLSIRNQLESHQKCVLELEKIISNLKENPPKKSDKRNRMEFEESIRFREEELQRYKTYSQLLEFELTKLHNMTNMRCISGTDVPFFCQPYHPISGINQSVLIPNQGIILNQQLLNGISSSDGGYMTNPILFNQPGALRFRPPALNNYVAISNNRRLRYRPPQSLNQSNIVPSVLSNSGSVEPPVTLAVTTSISDSSPSSPHETVFSPTSTNTFYEIV